ncbi:MAG TPA: hypothetical protein DCW71_06510 [Alistipes sp.]|nr:hypothetical protein [Alistipes sp.]
MSGGAFGADAAFRYIRRKNTFPPVPERFGHGVQKSGAMYAAEAKPVHAPETGHCLETVCTEIRGSKAFPNPRRGIRPAERSRRAKDRSERTERTEFPSGIRRSG